MHVISTSCSLVHQPYKSPYPRQSIHSLRVAFLQFATDRNVVVLIAAAIARVPLGTKTMCFQSATYPRLHKAKAQLRDFLEQNVGSQLPDDNQRGDESERARQTPG